MGRTAALFACVVLVAGCAELSGPAGPSATDLFVQRAQHWTRALETHNQDMRNFNEDVRVLWEERERLQTAYPVLVQQLARTQIQIEIDGPDSAERHLSAFFGRLTGEELKVVDRVIAFDKRVGQLEERQRRLEHERATLRVEGQALLAEYERRRAEREEARAERQRFRELVDTLLLLQPVRCTTSYAGGVAYTTCR